MTEFCYIHIPFCTKKCKYCGFTSFVNTSAIDDYINSLIIQIKKEYKNEPLETLYFGGGTPSVLKLEQVEKIINLFNFKNEAEITFELNPENSSADYFNGLHAIGINRLSIGIQSFNDKILAEIGRRHSANEGIETIKAARKSGFKNISIDLMYGLPNQTKEDFINTLKIAKNLDIEHISTYGLKIEENSIYGKKPPQNLPDEDMQADMYEILTDFLNDWLHYEISNFALSQEYISKHNMNYWKVKPYYGFGAGASGFFSEKTSEGGIRYKNTTSLKKYIENPFLKDEEIRMNKKSLLEEKIFLGFRKYDGIDVNEINLEFETDFNKTYGAITNKYIKTGHIKETKYGYKLTKKGILISNYILSEFL